MDATRGRRVRRPPPSSATIRLPKTEAAARPESRFGPKSSRSRLPRRRSEFPASRESSSAVVCAPFQKALRCHGVGGFATLRLQAGSGAEQGIFDDRNRSLSGAFETEQGKNRRAKTGRDTGSGRVVRRGQIPFSSRRGLPLRAVRRERAAPLVQKPSCSRASIS